MLSSNFKKDNFKIRPSIVLQFFALCLINFDQTTSETLIMTNLKRTSTNASMIEVVKMDVLNPNSAQTKLHVKWVVKKPFSKNTKLLVMPQMNGPRGYTEGMGAFTVLICQESDKYWKHLPAFIRDTTKGGKCIGATTLEHHNGGQFMWNEILPPEKFMGLPYTYTSNNTLYEGSITILEYQVFSNYA